MREKLRQMPKRDVNLLLILLAIIVFLVLYFLVYSKFNAKTEALEKEIDGLKPRLMDLQEKSRQIDTYNQSIKSDGADFNKMMLRYPNDVRPEDQIMYIVNLEESVGLTSDAISFGEKKSVLEFKGVKEDKDGNYQTVPLTGFQAPMTVSCKMGYQQMKDAVAFINKTNYSTVLDSLAISYDKSTGELGGVLAVSKYYISGMDNTYYETNVDGVNLGTANIFGTTGVVSPSPSPAPAK